MFTALKYLIGATRNFQPLYSKIQDIYFSTRIEVFSHGWIGPRTPLTLKHFVVVLVGNSSLSLFKQPYETKFFELTIWRGKLLQSQYKMFRYGSEPSDAKWSPAPIGPLGTHPYLVFFAMFAKVISCSGHEGRRCINRRRGFLCIGYVLRQGQAGPDGAMFAVRWGGVVWDDHGADIVSRVLVVKMEGELLQHKSM